MLECAEGVDDAVGECGGDELDVVAEDEAGEEVAVQGLVVVASEDDLVGAAARPLRRPQRLLEVRVPEEMSGGRPCVETTARLVLLAAVDELQRPPLLDRIFSDRETNKESVQN